MLAIWFLCWFLSGSSAFSKFSLCIRKFLVHILLKPSLKDFEHNLAGMWNGCNYMVVWTFFGIRMKTDLFQSCGQCRVFQFCWPNECHSLTTSSFRIWNSSAGIPSPPLALFVVTLSKAHLTSHSRIFGSKWVTTPSWLSRSLRAFLYSSYVYSCHLFLISSASFRFLTFFPLLCMKYSLGSSSFLKEISSLSHCIAFIYFFALFT